LKDEVLQKALTADSTVIPRYDIILPDGTKVAENAQLVLKNTVLTAGTALSKYTLLKDTTAALYGMGTNALPDEVLVAIRNSAGYCPKLTVRSASGATIYVQRVPEDVSTTTYTVPTTGVLSVDILFYGTYKVWGRINGVLVAPKYVDIVTTERYSVDIFDYVTYAKLTVDEEIGAPVQAVHTDGSTVSGVIGADKTCILPMYKTGDWACKGVYDTHNSWSRTLIATEATRGTTIDQPLNWTKIRVKVESGSIVTATRNSITKSGESIDGVCTLWLPETNSWTVKATKNGKTATATVYPVLHDVKEVTLTYA
jgi:hypothetical protein